MFMQKTGLLRFLTLAILPFIFSVNAAAKPEAPILQTYCYSDPKNFKNIQGLNIDTKFPVASVSKLVTSYWAISAKGPQFVYLSVVNVTPIGNGEFDLHIQGSHDPYFGQEKLHYMISKLNEKGVTKIRHLTFDENFTYLKELDIERDPTKEHHNFPWKNYYVDPVGPDRTLAELRKGLTDTYAFSVKRLGAAGVKLLPKVSFSVKDIAYVNSNQFTKAAVTHSYAIRSAPLYKLLKEMNRNSNNFAAVEIFKMLGGREKFAPFIKQQLGLGPDAIDFYEGSGNRAADEPVYNQATCRSLLAVFHELNLVMQKYSLDLDDVVSVMGEEGLVNHGFPYVNDANDGSGVAKTGTSAASITLGGMLNTKPQRMYFMYSVHPPLFIESAKRAARMLIGGYVRALSNKFRDYMTDFGYQKTAFVSFDKSSFDELSMTQKRP
jgi:D-alanyl-D-alanine carboxypeptidase